MRRSGRPGKRNPAIGGFLTSSRCGMQDSLRKEWPNGSWTRLPGSTAARPAPPRKCRPGARESYV